MKVINSERELLSQDEVSRARRIRSALPGQMQRERIETARASYGPLYTMAEIRRKVADLLPQRLGFMRGAAVEPVQTYQALIPDAALLKYDDAVQSGIFARFWVVTPTYYREQQLDPWIVGEIAGTGLCAVIAQWDVADG